MEYTKIKIKELIEKSEERELLLPNFQREFVWERSNNQMELLTSILYDIPIGSLLILNGESGFFATKELCIRKQCNEIVKEMSLYLLDGQQRISTIKSIFFDFFKDPNTWKENYENLYPKLRTRWFLKVKSDTNEKDLFGWKNLKFRGITSFNDYTPKEISNIIKYEVISKTQTEKWYHPEYRIQEWFVDGEVKKSNRNKIISEQAANEGLVPLYSILEEKQSTSLHYRVLKKIADKRMEDLKSEIEDDYSKIKDFIDISEDEIDDPQCIEEAWKTLVDDWVRDVINFLEKIKEKEIPIIQLTKDEMSRAIYTFEYVNKGGTALSTYDLIVAKAAHNKELESLTDRITDIINEDILIPDSILDNMKNTFSGYKWNANGMDVIQENELSVFIKNQYLNLLSIFSYFDYETDIEKIGLEYIKKDKHINIDHKKINDNTEITIKSLLRACAFLQFRCGIVKIQKLNYHLMILPIAYILRKDEYWNDKKTIDKIEYWYWSSLFGGSYREAPNEQCIEDIKKLFRAIKEKENYFEDRQNRVLNVEDYSSYETLIFESQKKKIPSAMEEGILQYVLSRQPRDFVKDNIYLSAWEISQQKEYYFEAKKKPVKLLIQDHHICPLKTATKLGQSSKELRSKKDFILNSPLNRTYISSIANELISDKKAEDYFKEVNDLAKYGHCIPSPIYEKYKQYQNEDEESYYKRIIKQRYDEIKRDIDQELDALK